MLVIIILILVSAVGWWDGWVVNEDSCFIVDGFDITRHHSFMRVYLFVV